MRLVVQCKGAKITELHCGDEPIAIGSGEACTVRLTDSRVAARHAVIHSEQDAIWILQPVQAGAEVLLNGTAITEEVMLKSGDLIQIHDYEIHTYIDHVHRGPDAGPMTTSVAQMNRFVRFQLPPGSLTKKADDPLTIQPSMLARIGAVNIRLGKCETVNELMDIVLEQVFEVFGAARAWIGIRRVNYGAMEYQQGQLNTGLTTELPSIGENLKPRVLDRAQFVLIPHVSLEESFAVIAGPLVGPDGLLGMVYVDAGDTGRRWEQGDLDFFTLMLNLFGVQLDAIFKHIAKTRAAMLEGEVSVVHAIQSRLTPRKLPQWEDQLVFGAFREPGRARSSDVYDVVRMPNDLAAFMIAHTSAVGPLPGMLMAQAQASFRTAAMHLDRPNIILRTLNVLLYDGQNDHPLSMFVGVVHPPSGKMKYAIAGEVGAYVISSRGEERRLAPVAPTQPLAAAKVAHYDELVEELAAEETLVLFTPGVVTARNSKDEVFGEDRFVNILCDGFGQLASAMLKEMLSDLRNFTESGQQPDDITVILAHRV